MTSNNNREKTINYDNKKEVLRPCWDEYFLRLAQTVSLRSHDGETQVGAVIVDSKNHTVSTGYNGFPANIDDENLPNLRPDKYPFFIHAEVNAIIGSKQDLSGCKIYVTYSPCRECAKLIIASGIKTCIYQKRYVGDDHDFILELMKLCGIAVRQYSL